MRLPHSKLQETPRTGEHGRCTEKWGLHGRSTCWRCRSQAEHRGDTKADQDRAAPAREGGCLALWHQPPGLPPHPTAVKGAPRTFVQHRAEDGQAVVDGGTVPAAPAELMLALLDADLDALRHAGHDLHVVSAEAQLLGDQAGDAGTQDGLSAQG